MLYVVATPLGNLGDIAPRALEALRKVDLIACEDTRHTSKLLHHFAIQKPLQSYHDYNEQGAADRLVKRIEDGLHVALVSDAGTPGISDPGYRLVRACRMKNIKVVAIPGPAAAMAALSISGLPSDQFLFVGFLPPKSGARRLRLESLKTGAATMVFYEAPHRVEDTLADMLEILGDREACLCREMTKLYEESTFGQLSQIRPQVRAQGEFVIVVSGADREDKEPIRFEGLSRKEILKLLADKTGVPKKYLYDLLLKD